MTDSNTLLPTWLECFPTLHTGADPVWTDVAKRAKQVVLPANQEVFREGDDCKQYIFVLAGATRVYKAFESGREMVLYRLQAGETCSLTTSVLLAGGPYPANAVTEKETRAVLIPISDFHAAFDQSKLFRDYVCSTFGGHVRELVMLLEAVSMRHVDVRLARWLLDNKKGGGNVEASHRELAFELGTAREVISRHLKDFESRGWVALQRRNIALKNIAEMRALVSGCRA